MGFDLSSIASTLLSGDALDGIVSSTGASKKDISSVLTSALPSLLSGAAKQSTGKDTALNFASALEQHAAKPTNNLASFFKDVDALDGSKIIGHLLGGEKDTTAEKIAKQSGVDPKTVAKILAVAAPLLMSLLGKKTNEATKEDKTSTTASLAQALLDGVTSNKFDVGDILGSLLKK